MYHRTVKLVHPTNKEVLALSHIFYPPCFIPYLGLSEVMSFLRIYSSALLAYPNILKHFSDSLTSSSAAYAFRHPLCLHYEHIISSALLTDSHLLDAAERVNSASGSNVGSPLPSNPQFMASVTCLICTSTICPVLISGLAQDVPVRVKPAC